MSKVEDTMNAIAWDWIRAIFHRLQHGRGYLPGARAVLAPKKRAWDRTRPGRFGGHTFYFMPYLLNTARVAVNKTRVCITWSDRPLNMFDRGTARQAARPILGATRRERTEAGRRMLLAQMEDFRGTFRAR